VAVKLVMNNLPAVADAIDKAKKKALREHANDLVAAYRASLWIRFGYIRRSARITPKGPFKLNVDVGKLHSLGFYAGFLEFGTIKAAARPMVAPLALYSRPFFVEKMANELKKAARAS
jgi:hypothetical protein